LELMTMEAREAGFFERLAAGDDVESGDWMPDAYRQQVLRFIEMHGNSELMGALPERDWIVRAPTLQRKLALTAKIQDEVGHAQLLFRLVEDLGKPRVQILEDLLEGRSKFHNVFHYPTRSWGDVGVIAWLVDAAAILSQKALLKCSYLPYRRVMQRICWEESFHILHGRDVILALMTGSEAQRELVQEALVRWWEPLMHFHGPPTPADKDRDIAWRIKSRSNEELRQEFLDVYVPRIRELGLTVPDPKLRHDEASGRWEYTEPDWERLRQIGRGNGPATQERLGLRRLSAEQTAWVRRAFALPAAA
jgi:ring-1,2-phenylacetyl-CoA epoxidase subunit PaaA